MSHTYFKIWIHAVWSTKDRQPFLHRSIRTDVFHHIKEKSEEKDIHLDMINGIDDHVHCLISLNPKYAFSDVVNALKGESSHWINSQDLLRLKFAWQPGYSAFSVSESLIQKVRNYILKQEEHHRKMSYAEELQELLKLHNLVVSQQC